MMNPTTTRPHALGRRLVGLVVAALGALVLGLMASAAPASASQPGLQCIGWDQLSNTPDGDRIDVSVQKLGDPRDIIFRMTTPTNITWWKQIKFVNVEGDALSQVYTQDNKHTTTGMLYSDWQLDGASLVFSKAKAFGVHTDMFQLCDLKASAGYMYTFNWNKD